MMAQTQASTSSFGGTEESPLSGSLQQSIQQVVQWLSQLDPHGDTDLVRQALQQSKIRQKACQTSKKQAAQLHLDTSVFSLRDAVEVTLLNEFGATRFSPQQLDYLTEAVLQRLHQQGIHELTPLD
jgi:hypothetical protein